MSNWLEYVLQNRLGNLPRQQQQAPPDAQPGFAAAAARLHAAAQQVAAAAASAPRQNPLENIPGVVGIGARAQAARAAQAQQQAQPIDPTQAIAGMVQGGALPAATVPNAIPGGQLQGGNPTPQSGPFTPAIDYASGVGQSLANAARMAAANPTSPGNDLRAALTAVTAPVANVPGISWAYQKHLGIVGDEIYGSVTQGKSTWDPYLAADVDQQLTDWYRNPANAKTIVDAHDTGLDTDGDGTIDLKGGQAVYAAYLASMPPNGNIWVGNGSLVDQIVTAAGLDPLTYAAFVSSGAGGLESALARKAASGAELSTTEKMLLYAAKGAHAVTTVPNEVANLPNAALGTAAKGLFESVRRITGGAVDPAVLAEVSDAAKRTDYGTSLAEARRAQLAGREADTGPLGTDVAPTTGATPATEPTITEPATAATAAEPTTAAVAAQARDRIQKGSGQYDAARVRSGRNEEWVLVDPDGTAIERVRADGVYGPDGVKVRDLPKGSTPGTAARTTRNALNDDLALKHAAGIDVPGTNGAAVTGKPGRWASAEEWLTPPTDAAAGPNGLHPLPTNGATEPVPPVGQRRVLVAGPDGALHELTPDEQAAAGIRWGDQPATNGLHAVPTTGAEPSATGFQLLKGHWIDPASGRTVDYQPGVRMPSLIEHVAEDIGAIDPAAKERFIRRYEADPRTQQFVDEMAAHDAEAQRVARADATARGRTPDTVQGTDTADKVLTGIKHTVEVQRPLYRDAVGAEPPPFRFDHGNGIDEVAANPLRSKGQGTRYDGAADDRNLVERAVFGTDEEATRAREYWHVQAARKDLPLPLRAKAQQLLDETSRLRLDEQSKLHATENGTVPPAGVNGVADAGAGAPGVVADRPTEADRLFAEGKLDQGQRDILGTPVVYNRRPMTLGELFDTAAADMGDEAKGRRFAISLAKKAQFGEQAAPVGWHARALKALHVYDKASQLTKEGIQFNLVRGALGSLSDAITDGFAMTLEGHGQAAVRMLDPADVARTFRAVRDMDPKLLNELDAFQPLAEAGLQIPQQYLPGHGEARDDVGRSGEMTLHRGVVALTGGKSEALNRVTGAITGIVANKTWRDLRNGFDTTRRIVLHADQSMQDMPEAIDRWRSLLQERYPEQATALFQEIKDAAQARQAAAGKTYYGLFSPEDVRQVADNEVLARAWRAELSTIDQAARKEVDRILFSYKKTNLDEGLSRAVFFHYWQSRALALHARIALRNPWLMAAYWRTWQGLQREAEQKGYPPSAKGYLDFMGNTATGWYGMFSPLGIIVPFTMFSDMAGKEDQPAWQRIGLFLNPWLEGAAAALGRTDNVPDPTGTYSVRNIAAKVINYANAHGLPIGTDHPTEDVVHRVERTVYQQANKIVGWAGLTSKGYGPYDPGTTQTVQLRAVVEQIAAQKYGPASGWTPAQKDHVQDAESRVLTGAKGNDLAEAAWQTWTKAMLEGGLASLAIPGGVRMAYGPLETNRISSAAGYGALDQGGQPTPAQNAAMDTQARVNAGDNADLALETQQQEYQGIGTQRQRDLAKYWQVIAYGKLGDQLPLGSVVKIGDTYVQATKLASMTDAERKLLADQYVRTQDGTDELKAYRDERDAWVQEHPELAGFQQFQDTVRSYTGGPSGFRREMVRRSKGYAAAVEKQKQRIGNGDAAVVTKELDNWTTSLAGYETASGIRSSIYDAKPTGNTGDWQGLTANDKILQGGTGGGSGSGSGSSSRLNTLVKNLAAYQDASDKMFAATGLRPEQVNSPYSQRALQAQGIYPNVPRDVQLYWAWAAQQPPGADTSPQTYDKFLDDLKSQQAA